LEKGHSATKEFLDAIKKWRTQALITKLEGEDGQVVTTQEEVVACYKKYYSKQYMPRV
jgi:hypothetical protein